MGSLLPSGTFANPQQPLFLNANGPVRISDGELEITNTAGLEGPGSMITMSPIHFQPPLVSIPTYSIVTDQENGFYIGRLDTPGALFPESTFISSYPVSAEMTGDIENTIVLNGDVTVAGDIFTPATISAFYGLRYETNIIVGDVNDNPPSNERYYGATMYIEPWPLGNGRLDYYLPGDFYSDPKYVGTILFVFVCDTTDTQTINIIDSDNVLVNSVVATEKQVITVYNTQNDLTIVRCPLLTVSKTSLSKANRPKASRAKASNVKKS